MACTPIYHLQKTAKTFFMTAAAKPDFPNWAGILWEIFYIAPPTYALFSTPA
jgi:hypothetical protein